MVSVEYDGLINDTLTADGRLREEIVVAFRTDRFGIIQVEFELLETTELSEVEKSVEEMDAKLSTSVDEPNLNMFSEEDRHYIKKWCTAVWICVFAAEEIGGQNS